MSGSLRGDRAHDAKMLLDGFDATRQVLLGALHGVGIETAIDAVDLAFDGDGSVGQRVDASTKRGLDMLDALDEIFMHFLQQARVFQIDLQSWRLL